MTSSLVGSEMCIRDSPKTPPPRLKCRPSRGRNSNGQHVYGQGHKNEVPVSYTHLTLPTICSV
eukprot:10218994-Prorocentrum_lima.AAC.1